MNDLMTFEQDKRLALADALTAKHEQLAQLHITPSGKRSLTARNYNSSIEQFRKFRDWYGGDMPTRGVLEAWRDAMLVEGRAVSTINARLSAVRKLLRGVAADTTDLQVKLVFESWAGVENAKAYTSSEADKTEVDYGLRLTHPELETLVASIEISTVKGLRDRALLAVMVGAGLRVSEAVNVTMRDVFLTENDNGQRGVKVTKGKHHKSRVVVLNSWNSWVVQAVEAYAGALGLSPMTDADTLIFRSANRWGADTGKPLSARGGQRAVETLTVMRDGDTINISAHDLRRTYAKLCKASGMSWEALQANMGHSSVKITQDYVGRSVDWSERVPNWTIKLKG